MTQNKLPLIGEARKVEYAPFDLIKRCRDGRQAIQLCIQLSGMSHEAILDALDIDKGHFSRILQGRANFPDHKRTQFMRICGNRAPMQFDHWDLDGVDITPALSAKERRAQELLAEYKAIQDELDNDQREAG